MARAGSDLAVRVVDGIRQVPRASWNALVGDGPPFLEWDWLAALEDAGTVTSETGWLPQHATLWSGETLVGACPLYVKGHSMGEFVFDWDWARAAERAGLDYYPKLLVGIPFTPITGTRFLAAPGAEALVRSTLAALLEGVCREQELSSAHVNFCLPEETAALEARGWLQRTGYQYHWTNEGFRSFDDYLTSLRSKRRNQARRERRELLEQDVTVSVYAGAEITDDMVPTLYRIYHTGIVENPWGHLYLNERFFELTAERLRPYLCFVIARQGGEVIAGTWNIVKGDTFYGRYWGTFRTLRHLHFNVCYYAAIEYCIERGLRRFEPGAGGQWKHLRGFEARTTESAHWIRDQRFRAAVADFLRRERASVARDVDWLDERTALRRDRDDET